MRRGQDDEFLYQRSASNDADGREMFRSPKNLCDPQIRPMPNYPTNYYQTR